MFKLIAFDVDGTLTEGNIWERLHNLVGISKEQDYAWWKDYYDKKISFERWSELVISIYRKSKKTRKDLETVMGKTTLLPDVEDTIFKLKQKYQLALISIGVDVHVETVAKMLGIDIFQADYSFVYDSNNLVVDIFSHAKEDKAKVIFLKALCQKRNIKPEQIVFVGDSRDDEGAFKFTKHGVLVGRGDKDLVKIAWKTIPSIKYLLDVL